MTSISYTTGCTYIRGDDKAVVLQMAQTYEQMGFELTPNKSVKKFPKYYEAVLVPVAE